MSKTTYTPVKITDDATLILRLLEKKHSVNRNIAVKNYCKKEGITEIDISRKRTDPYKAINSEGINTLISGLKDNINITKVNVSGQCMSEALIKNFLSLINESKTNIRHICFDQYDAKKIADYIQAISNSGQDISNLGKIFQYTDPNKTQENILGLIDSEKEEYNTKNENDSSSEEYNTKNENDNSSEEYNTKNENDNSSEIYSVIERFAPNTINSFELSFLNENKTNTQCEDILEYDKKIYTILTLLSEKLENIKETNKVIGKLSELMDSTDDTELNTQFEEYFETLNRDEKILFDDYCKISNAFNFFSIILGTIQHSPITNVQSNNDHESIDGINHNNILLIEEMKSQGHSSEKIRDSINDLYPDVWPSEITDYYQSTIHGDNGDI